MSQPEIKGRVRPKMLRLLLQFFLLASLSIATSATSYVEQPIKQLASEASFSLPDHRKEYSSTTNSNCDFRLWVRSEDLRPSTVIEGDVRLFNNLTATSPEHCRIQSWSLGLRFKERAILEYLTGRPARPQPPEGFNLTRLEDEKGEEDLEFDSNQMFLGSIRETVRDDSREMKKEWNLELEKWVEKVREWEEETAHYAFENETTIFETLLDMGVPESTRIDGEANQHQISSFGVAIPSTNFPPNPSNRRTEESLGGLSYSGLDSYTEYDMSYFALITLSNGSTVEVYGGSVNFVPMPQTDVALSLSKGSQGHLPTSFQGLEFRKARKVQTYEDPDFEEDAEVGTTDGSGWKLEVEMPFEESFVQGGNYTLNGRLIAPELATSFPIGLSAHLNSASFNHWTVNTLKSKLESEGTLDIDLDLDYSGSPSNASEILEKVTSMVGRSSDSLRKHRISVMHLDSLLNPEDFKYHGLDYEDLVGLDDDDYELLAYDESTYHATPWPYSFEKEVTSELQTHSTSNSYDFQFSISIPNNTLPSHVTSFKTITASLNFILKTVNKEALACLYLHVLKEKKVDIDTKLKEKLECHDSSSAHQQTEMDKELSNWVQRKGYSKFWENFFKSQYGTSWSSGIPGLIRIEHGTDVEVKIVPRLWEQPKRTLELEEKISKSELSEKELSPLHYSEDSNIARAPILIRESKEVLLEAVDLLLEERRHRFSSSNSADSAARVSIFPIIKNISKSKILTHIEGIHRFHRWEVERRLGSEHLIFAEQLHPAARARLDSERFNFRSRKLDVPSSYSHPESKGSASLDIGAVWNEHVMLEVMKERDAGGVK